MKKRKMEKRILELTTALRKVQTALANHRDGIDPVLVDDEDEEGNATPLTLEEVKYCVVDPALGD